MQSLTASGITTVQELWLMVSTEEERPEALPEYIEGLWLMVSHVCSAYAIQHRGAGDPYHAEGFEDMYHQALARQPLLKISIKARPKLAIVKSLRGLPSL